MKCLWNMPLIGTSYQWKKQCLVKSACMVELLNWVLPSSMRASFIVQELIMSGVVMGAFFLQCSVMSYILCSIDIPIVVYFALCIIHHTELMPLNLRHTSLPWISDLTVIWQFLTTSEYTKKLFRLHLPSNFLALESVLTSTVP